MRNSTAIKHLLDQARPRLGHPCDLDLLRFFRRHPRALLTSERSPPSWPTTPAGRRVLLQALARRHWPGDAPEAGGKPRDVRTGRSGQASEEAAYG